LLLFALIVVLVFIGAGFALAVLGLLPGPDTHLEDAKVMFTPLMSLVAGAVATLACVLFQRADAGLRDPRWARRLALGATLGATGVIVSVCVSTLSGHEGLSLNALPATAIAGSALRQFVFMSPAGVGEELLARGVFLRTLCRPLHPAIAVFITGGIFGLAHLGNPDASWYAALNVALVGWWFGALAIRTGSLWSSVGAHVAWNFFEGFVLGQPVSGMRPRAGLLVSSWEPRGFFSGGDFGPEASGVTTVVLTVLLAATCLWPRTRSSSAPDASGGPPLDDVAGLRRAADGAEASGSAASGQAGMPER